MMPPRFLDTSSAPRGPAAAPFLVRASSDLPSEEIEIAVARIHPQGEAVSLSRMRVEYLSTIDGTRITVRELEPGDWPHSTLEHEFCHVLTGNASYLYEDAAPYELAAGDTILFHPHTKGTLTITKCLRWICFSARRTW